MRLPLSALRERHYKSILFALCLIPAALITWAVMHQSIGPDPVRALEDQTGEWTLRFLAITLAVTPARRLSGINVLGRYRRMLGLFTFFYAALHVSMWVGLDWFFDWRAMGGEIVKHKYILVGMATFVMLLPLALTSTKGWVRRLGGARWARLHRLVYLCAIGGTVHYLWSVKKDTFFPLVYLLTFAALLGVRLFWTTASRSPRRASSLSSPVSSSS